eukprot:4343552-Prymnesium_polylepis.1
MYTSFVDGQGGGSGEEAQHVHTSVLHVLLGGRGRTALALSWFLRAGAREKRVDKQITLI